MTSSNEGIMCHTVQCPECEKLRQERDEALARVTELEEAVSQALLGCALKGTAGDIEGLLDELGKLKAALRIYRAARAAAAGGKR